MGRLASNQDYVEWLTDLKLKIRRNQVKAAVQVNETLLRLYWDMEREINERQKKSKWGSGFLAQLSRDLMTEFPDMKGFSRSNLQYIKRFYAFYVGATPICEQVARKLVPDGSNGICEQAARKLEIVANDSTTQNHYCPVKI